MRPELVAEQQLTVPAGRVWLTLARHDDGHYSGVATLLPSGRRIGWLASNRLGTRCPSLAAFWVDPTVAGAAVRRALETLFRVTARAEATQLGQRARVVEPELISSAPLPVPLADEAIAPADSSLS